jgi:hypothetical protein
MAIFLQILNFIFLDTHYRPGLLVELDCILCKSSLMSRYTKGIPLEKQFSIPLVTGELLDHSHVDPISANLDICSIRYVGSKLCLSESFHFSDVGLCITSGF